MDIQNNQKLIVPTILTGIIGILIISIYNSAFKNSKFTCKRYILNSYLYILLILVIVISEILILDYKNIKVKDIYGNFTNKLSFFMIFILIIFLLIITMMTNPKNVISKHLFWLLFGLSIGLILYPSYIKSKESNVLLEILFSLIAILVIFSVIAFFKPDIISLSMGPILLFSLIGIIIYQFTNYLFSKKIYRTPKWLSYIIIVIFILFILYDTKLIQIHAKNCREQTVDYINESLGIFLDATNLFLQLVNIRT